MWAQCYLLNARRDLTNRLVLRRGTFLTRRGLKPVCAICQQPILDSNCDTHEAIFTRGDVMGLDFSLRHIVFHACNSVLRHHTCNAKQYHTAGHGSEDEIRRCVEQLAEFETPTKVLAYIAWVIEVVPVLKPQARRAINIILTGKKEE